jgi:mannose-binding lectin 1
VSRDARTVTNWHTIGKPKVLPDRVLLTDQGVPNQKNAMWADNKNDRSEWGVAFRFLATGMHDNTGSGNFNLWYVKDGSRTVQTSDVYNTPAFEGLVISVDSDNGRGGIVRGYVNDGTKDFRHNHHLETLAFGHCNFLYRNTHKIALISIKQTKDYLEVLTDGRTCFRSDVVKMPPGYYFGLTANAKDRPDVIEAISFFLLPDAGNALLNEQHPTDGHMNDPYHPYGGEPPIHNPNFQQMFHAQQMHAMPDRDAHEFNGQQEQFVDLHMRMQGLSHQVDQFYNEMVKFAQAVEAHQKELITVLSTHLMDKETTSMMHKQVEAIEHLVHDIKSNVHDQDFKFKMDNIHETVMAHHQTLLYELPEHLHGCKCTY